MDIDKAISIGGNTILSKNINLFRQRISKFSSENNYKFLITTGSQVFASGSVGNVKRYHVVRSYTDATGSVTIDGFGFENAEHVFPGTFISSSEFSGYNRTFSADIAGLHLDTIDDDLEIPVQGPFTSEHVGGLQYRHQGFNKDVASQRPEGFKVFPYNGNQGLVHISELAERHVEIPEQVVQVGDKLFVKIIDIDLERRRISLSLKQANEGQEVEIEAFDPTQYGMPARYDPNGKFIYPEGFDPQTQEWAPGYESQKEEWERQYKEAQARFLAHKKQKADAKAADAAAASESSAQ